MTASMTQALEKWLTAVPRWGHTQQDDLDDLLRDRKGNPPAIPAAALAHPRPLQALLEAGLRLDSIDLGSDPSLRWVAVLRDAPLEVHALLTAAGEPELDETQFTSRGRVMVDQGLCNSLRYAAHALPDTFRRVTQEGPMLLMQMALAHWEEKPASGMPVVATLVDLGVSPEHWLSKAGRLKKEKRERLEVLLRRAEARRLERVLPAAVSRPAPRM